MSFSVDLVSGLLLAGHWLTKRHTISHCPWTDWHLVLRLSEVSPVLGLYAEIASLLLILSLSLSLSLSSFLILFFNCKAKTMFAMICL